MLDERKMRILQAITDDYIQTAEPVGSRTVARRYGLGVSPATIRNEMADLEELGYLQQPHTSAGRIPSSKGYRYYVDTLMEPEPLDEEARRLIRQEVMQRRHAMEDLIQRSARLLALLSRYTAVVVAPRLSNGIIHRIQLVGLEGTHVLVMCIVQPGFVLNRVVDVRERLDAPVLQGLSDYLSEKLRGKTVSDLGSTLLSELREPTVGRGVIETVIELLEETRHDDGEEVVYLDGMVNILNQPEFRDVEKAKPLLAFLDEREAVFDVVSEYTPSSGVRVTIGEEHSRPEMHPCSMVLASYHIGGDLVGTLGVMGPTRMEYSRVVTLVEMMAQDLSEMLTRTMR